MWIICYVRPFNCPFPVTDRALSKFKHCCPWHSPAHSFWERLGEWQNYWERLSEWPGCAGSDPGSGIPDPWIPPPITHTNPSPFLSCSLMSHVTHCTSHQAAQAISCPVLIHEISHKHLIQHILHMTHCMSYIKHYAYHMIYLILVCN